MVWTRVSLPWATGTPDRRFLTLLKVRPKPRLRHSRDQTHTATVLSARSLHQTHENRVRCKGRRSLLTPLGKGHPYAGLAVLVPRHRLGRPRSLKTGWRPRRGNPRTTEFYTPTLLAGGPPLPLALPPLGLLGPVGGGELHGWRPGPKTGGSGQACGAYAETRGA